VFLCCGALVLNGVSDPGCVSDTNENPAAGTGGIGKIDRLRDR